MAKKERKQKTGASQPPLLEDLLGAGEAVLYGQVCWSIANRGTEPPKAGEVITLEGEYEEKSLTSRSFRLTRKSIENVERCLGMRTCGEAVALFAEREEVEPWGECPQGHQEAAFDFMMHGIRPTEPCPECGEIPNFGNTMMSLDLHSDGPVRGVDSQEYTTCRGCGDDTLQLEGSSIVECGWKITCLNCGWEMKQAETLDIVQYCDLMEEVKSRVESVNQLMEFPGITIRTRVESICLQLRSSQDMRAPTTCWRLRGTRAACTRGCAISLAFARKSGFDGLGHDYHENGECRSRTSRDAPMLGGV